MARVILTLVGDDRPGLTELLASAIAQAGGNWLESRLSALGGHYVGSVLVELPGDAVSKLRLAADAAGANGLKIHLIEARGNDDAPGTLVDLEIVGQDRPGIVREVTAALSRIGVNIQELSTAVENSSWSGAPLFRAEATLLLPAGVAEEAVRHALEQISGEIMVDFALQPASARED